MRIEQFKSLSSQEQLKVISNLGRIKHSVIENDYQLTLYKVKSFYVELRRCLKDVFFETITAMDYEKLPSQYKQARLHKDPW
jgi:hypothetical protein